MRVGLLLAICAGVLGLSPASAQSSEIIGKPIGQWTIKRSIDPMTDAKSCTAYFRNNNVQLTKDSFAVGYNGRGGLKGYEIRIDDKPASEMQVPTRSEERMSAILIEGLLFDQIKAAKRVRVRALSRLNSIVNDDIDTSAIPRLMAVLNGAQCS